MCYMENKSLFFDVMKNGHIFLHSFINLNIISDSFFSRGMGALKHARRYACKNVLNLDCQDSIHFGIYQVTYK